jgi:hypothetical protein
MLNLRLYQKFNSVVYDRFVYLLNQKNNYMKQNRNLLYTCIILFTSITIQKSFSQTPTQLKGWHIAPNLIDLKTTPNVKPPFTTNAGTPGSNSIYDSEGKLLFYVANYNKIYNKFNQLIGTMALGYVGLSEISIVPNPANDACTNKYYIIYPQDVSGSLVGTLRYDVVDMNGNSGLGSFATGATLSANVSNPTANPIAVSKLVGGNRYLYYIHSTFFQLAMHTITATGITSSPTFLTPSFGAGTSAYELELSNAGDKIAFHKGGSPSNQITVLDLNPTTGLATGTFYDFTAASSIYGLEFDNTGNKLFYSTGTGVYAKYLTTPFNQVTVSTTFNKSMLEKNYTGNKILCATTSQLNWIDASTDVLNLTPISCALPYNPTYNFVLMPDQIDGENYDATGTTNVDVDIFNVSANAIWDVTANPFLAVQQNSYLGSLTVLPKVRVARQINIPSGFSIINNQLPFEFHTNAEWNVNGGANLRLMGTLLQGHSCGLMWRGISVNNNNSTNANNFKMTNNGAVNSIIYDAYKGVEANGNNATVIIENNSLFDKNEKGVVLNSVNPSLISITGSYFYSTLPLKDQTRGQVLSTSGSVMYGITGIETNISGTPVNMLKIGTATLGNYFKSGQYGINSLNTDIQIQKNDFQLVDRAAIGGNASGGGARETYVLDNTFLSNNTDTWLSFGCNERLHRNTFSNAKTFSVYWTYNWGRLLEVGDEFNAANANTFQGFIWAGVAVGECQNPNTEIKIHYNTFKNAPWAGGVKISESTLTTGQTYKGYKINNNTFTNIGSAAYILNVRGSSATNNDYNGDALASDNFDMQNNTINFATSYNASAVAVKVENSERNRVFSNTITSDNSGNWQNQGISYLNSPNGLIKKNTIQAGIGIGLGLDLLGGNVVCNTLKYSVVGITPSWGWIRASGVPHGNLSPNIGRQNTFISNSTDIDVYYSYAANWQWMSPNTTLINYNPGGSYGTNIIYSIPGSSPCGTVTTRLSGEEMADSSSITSTNGFIPANYDADIMLANNKGKQLMNGMQAIKANNAAALAANNSNSLAKAQIAYENKNYAACNAYLNQLSNSDKAEKNVAEVLGILNNCRSVGRYEYTEAEKNKLIAIAQSDARVGGQGVHYARGILLANYNMQFQDPYLYEPASKAERRMIKQVSADAVNEQLLGLYPNPAKNLLTISTNEGKKSVNIYNNMGAKVYTNTSNGNITIDVSSWYSGMYQVEIIDTETNKKETSKFIIE